jgi:hypothetical protein
MEPLLDKVSRHINLRRFIVLSALITIGVFVVVAVLVFLYEHNWLPYGPKHPVPDGMIYGVSTFIAPLGGLYVFVCDRLGVTASNSVWVILTLTYGPFWALMIELAIKFWPRKRRVVVK